jgi:hypothetical protein
MKASDLLVYMEGTEFARESFKMIHSIRNGQPKFYIISNLSLKKVKNLRVTSKQFWVQ